MKHRWTLFPAVALVAAVLAGVAVHSSPIKLADTSGCGLAQAAFCDTFPSAAPPSAAREGGLNPANWSAARVTANVHPFPIDTANTFYPAAADVCGTTSTVQPDGDSFVCGGSWGTTLNDGGNYDATQRLADGTHPTTGPEGDYVAKGARIRQPFDFAGRTGTVAFKVDAQLDGSGNNRPHGAWPEVWLTDQPVQDPHLTYPDTHLYPRNGVNFTFNDCPGATSTQNLNSINEIVVFDNFVPTEVPMPQPADCFATQKDNPNQFQIKVSQSNLEVWASDAGGANFRKVASVPVSLGFTRGYLSFEHGSYNAAKYGASNTSTFHWSAIGFDGPVLPVDRAYEVPDALHVNTAADQNGDFNKPGSVNLGYQIGAVNCNTAGCSTPTFSLAGVDPSNSSEADLTYDIWFDGAPHQITATVNGTAFTFADPNPDGAGPTCTNGCPLAWRTMVQPIPLSALHAGTNTVSFSDPGSTAQNPTIANIDLNVVPTGTSTPSTTVPPTTMVPPTTAPAAASQLTCPVVASPVVGQQITCTY